jgi:xanthine dehydrogenase YagR molybdenum-binding subunit
MPIAIGQPLDRTDARLKVTGKAAYTADQDISGLAHAVLVASSIAKGRIARIDASAAERSPGVLAVITHQSGLKLAKDPEKIDPNAPADRKLQLLQNDRVLYANQPIAVVVGETLEAAQEGAALVQIDYAAETPSVTIEAGLANATIPEKLGGSGDPAQSARGDVSAGMAQADQRVEQTYSTPFQHHNPMEPHATIASWQSPDQLMLYDATQGIFGARKRIAGLFGLKPENVRIVSQFVGGGFGSKGPCWSHVALCAMAAQHVNRPVKLVLRRPQMFGPIGCRSATRQSITAGAQRDGTLLALKNDTVTQTSSFDDFVEPATTPARMLYAVPNNSTVQRLVRSDIGTPSYMRAPGEAPGTFALESAMDELAYALKMDPVALRLKNYADKDEDKKLPWSEKSLRECYRLGADKFGWSRRTPEPGSMREGNTLIGWGMATSLYPAIRLAASARARLNPDGTIMVEAGTQEIGGGTYTVMTQIAADALGAPVNRVTFRLGDTRFPETPVSGGSMTVASTGSAVLLAARALRDKVVQIAVADPRSALFQARLEDVLIEDGRISRRGRPGEADTFDAVMRRSGQPYVEAEARAEAAEKSDFSKYSFGAQFAEVRVDADLGQIRLSRMVGAFGAGKILNAKTARSQFIGGMVWGVSFALYEDSVHDQRLGRIVNNNLAEYHVPTNADIGPIDIVWVDSSDEHVDPIGAKGIGEIGITGASAAVANAVYHATGKRVRDLPITLDKLL